MTNENYSGVTTGTVATACSLAALDAILDSSDVACVKVETPKKTLDIIIDECKKLSSFKAYAVAHKNPYNDPDVTVNLEIFATVELLDKSDKESNVIITGGEGVGKVTKPGLQIPVGEYAINPVPRSMIIRNLEETKTGIVTNNFHIYRSVKIAELQGYKEVFALPATTNMIVFPNYMTREFLALGKMFILLKIKESLKPERIRLSYYSLVTNHC